MWLAVLLLACEQEKLDTGSPPIPPWELDDDGDDYTADEDCDDADAAIHPGAPEVCDGLDQDCDLVVDEDAVDALDWHPDADGDGAYDVVGVRACDPPAGAAERGDDCDDADATVFPGATEDCDGVDDDCDGTVDEDATTGAPTWHADADGDGFGDISAGVASCEAPEGYVEDARDCDDADPLVHPDAPEVCNRADDDCDGVADDDATDARTWYTDADGDAHGDAATAVVACVRPADGSPDGDDCDDADPAVYPGADEHCDGADEDCDGSADDAAVDAPTWYVDDDSDGYGVDTATTTSCRSPLGYAPAPGDCDDTDAAIAPDQPEVCDDVDQDCDGTPDDDATDALTWYADLDGDGYGDPSDLAYACDPPTAYVADASDCDGADATHHPGADEVCDGADDDCDGTVDEDDAVDAPAWYGDDDGDGLVDPSDLPYACAAPAAHVSDATDCDDADATHHPGADEYCDSADDDCDGTVDEDDAVDAPAWFADADGDGYGDVSVSTRACSEPGGYVGDISDCDDTNAYVNPARSETCSDGIDNDCDGDDNGCVQDGTLGLDAVYHARVVGSSYADSVGSVVAHGGDVDADGYADLVVGASGLAEVWLVRGLPFGDLDTTDVAGAFVGSAREGWGSALAGVGDADGDGYDDVLLGGSDADDGGIALLLPGPWDAVEHRTDATLELVAEGEIDLAGEAVAGAGDLDGDGLADLLVGASQADMGTDRAGAAYVVYGGATGTLSLSAADGTLRGANPFAQMGYALAGVGDVDGDGLDDVLVGSPGDRTGAVLGGAAYLVLGPASGTLTADAAYYGEATYDSAGVSVAGAGDTDGDGARELLVGAHYHDGGGSNSGGAYLLRGPFAGTASLGTAAAAEVYGEAAGDLAGATVAGAGDFDQDGYDDWVVGAWANDLGGASGGATFLLYGPGPWSADLAAADLLLTGGAGAWSGLTVSGGGGPWGRGDLTGDGVDDLLVGAPRDDAAGTAAGAGYVIAGRGL